MGIAIGAAIGGVVLLVVGAVIYSRYARLAYFTHLRSPFLDITDLFRRKSRGQSASFSEDPQPTLPELSFTNPMYEVDPSTQDNAYGQPKRNVSEYDNPQLFESDYADPYTTPSTHYGTSYDEEPYNDLVV